MAAALPGPILAAGWMLWALIDYASLPTGHDFVDNSHSVPQAILLFGSMYSVAVWVSGLIAAVLIVRISERRN